jgi:hypothetical protein
MAKGGKRNGAGRPKGARNKATLAVLELLDGEAEALTRKVIERALEGDSTALRLCLERICPPRKSHPVNIKLPSVKNIAGVAEAQAAVVRAVADSEITPDEGATIANILEARRKSIETMDYESRLTALEAKAQ